jgi:hypothetical protein
MHFWHSQFSIRTSVLLLIRTNVRLSFAVRGRSLVPVTICFMRALDRGHVYVFNPDRKDTTGPAEAGAGPVNPGDEARAIRN